MGLVSQIQVRQETIDLGSGRAVKLVTPIGKGSVSTVYRGELSSANGLRRPVATKVFSAVSSDEAEHVMSCLAKTARRAACVAHPNVVQVQECFDWRGQPCVITELVDGINLAALQTTFTSSRRRLPLDLALYIIAEVAEGLSGARVARSPDGLQLGMLHQSVTSRDVLLSWRGEVKVSDFEMQSARIGSSSIRSLGVLAARAASFSPEIASGIEGDARSDVFAFGVMMYELLIGPRFPAGLTHGDTMKLAREGYVQTPTFRPNLPSDILAVMNRCLEVHPEARYPNAVALAYDLRRAVLAMGVGDGRYFLRRTLDHEFAERGEEHTDEMPALNMAVLSEDDLQDDDVAEIRPAIAFRRK